MTVRQDLCRDVLLLAVIFCVRVKLSKLGRAISLLAFGRIHDHNVGVALRKHLYGAAYRLNRIIALVLDNSPATFREGISQSVIRTTRRQIRIVFVLGLE